MTKNHHLIRRGERFYYHRRVPLRLVPILGRKFIKKALGVTSLAEALKKRTVEELKANALFAQAEAGLAGKGAGTAAQPLSTETLTEYVREAVQTLDKRAAERQLQTPPQDPKQLVEARESVEDTIGRLRDEFDPNTGASPRALRSAMREEMASFVMDQQRPGGMLAGG